MTQPDRRIRRTRRSLHEALIALVLERGYESVTVQDIIDRADVGRSTFYAHFRDKEALLLSSFDDLRADLRRDLDATADLTQPSAALFSHAYRHRTVYRALCGRQASGAVVHRHLHEVIGALLRERPAPREHRTPRGRGQRVLHQRAARAAHVVGRPRLPVRAPTHGPHVREPHLYTVTPVRARRSEAWTSTEHHIRYGRQPSVIGVRSAFGGRS